MFPTRSEAPATPVIPACPTIPHLAAFPTKGAFSAINLPAAFTASPIPSVCEPTQVVLVFKISSANLKTSSPTFAPVLEAAFRVSTIFGSAPNLAALLAAFKKSDDASTTLAVSFTALPAVPTVLAAFAALLACITNFPALVAPKPIADKAVNPKFPAKVPQSDLSQPSFLPSNASNTVLVAPPTTPKTGTIEAAEANTEAFCNPDEFFQALETSVTEIIFPFPPASSELPDEEVPLFFLEANSANEIPSCALIIPPCLRVNIKLEFSSFGSNLSDPTECNLAANFLISSLSPGIESMLAKE
jgi:hypothetical protein